jgi:hypothetical protein
VLSRLPLNSLYDFKASYQHNTVQFVPVTIESVTATAFEQICNSLTFELAQRCVCWEGASAA